ncbi:MAG TPA: T9SS type A sorting domain-containing protein [Tenuifilaceae bacterium]|nr:T9SS type A sorting domain-containing protein [Tenuifilaceae bacterium]
MKRLFFTLLLLTALTNYLFADTLTVMQYNLMYYDKEYDDCTSETNNVDSKDGYLRTIVEYVNPDILTVNEVNASIASVERIKNNVLNVNGVTKYLRANFSGDFLANMLYYNSEKLELISQSTISTSPRETNVYKLKVIASGSAKSDDIYLYCFVTHLKAGSYSSDEEDRTTAATAIMNYISTNNITGNVLLMGDMNLYRASEGAFTTFTTPIGTSQFRFYDPINQVGDWNNNYDYRLIHSQSTHSSSEPCFSSGGMDDRFDFILSSSNIISGTDGLKFVDYKTIAQDGNRFNQSLISPENSSVPTDVLNALYSMSDHLPIRMQLYYDSNTSSVSNNYSTPKILYNNPVTNTLNIKAFDPSTKIKSVSIYNIIGKKLTEYNANNLDEVNLNIADAQTGLLIVSIRFSNNKSITFKVLHNSY